MPHGIERIEVLEVKRLFINNVEVTSPAVDLNSISGASMVFLDTVVPGTVVASKALVVDTSKALDTLVVAALKLGAGAGTAVTATAAEINTLHSSGITNADLVKVHAVTASAAELSTLASSGATNADLVKLHAVTATAAVVNSVAAAVGTVTFDRSPKIALVALVGNTIHAGVTAWVNPEAVSIIVDRIELDVTTIATGAGTIKTGTTAASITTASANLIDTLDVHSSTGVFDNLGSPGSGGKALQKLAAAKWVTFGEASGDLSGMVGNAYIHYHLV